MSLLMFQLLEGEHKNLSHVWGQLHSWMLTLVFFSNNTGKKNFYIEFCQIPTNFPVGFLSSSLVLKHLAWSVGGDSGLYSQRINDTAMTQLLTGLDWSKHEKAKSCVPETLAVPLGC